MQYSEGENNLKIDFEQRLKPLRRIHTKIKEVDTRFEEYIKYLKQQGANISDKL